MLKHLDLFSGIGGFSLAARRCGSDIQTVQFVEINPDAQKVLRSQFPGVPIHADIRDYTPKPKFDLITMGFPCTGTSSAGTRTGLEHPASSLWREGLRCLLLVRPKFCVIEQPEGVIRRGLRAILGGLRLAGYDYEIEAVTAQELGAGHQRIRLFIISYPYQQRELYQQTSWADQMREMVQGQRADCSWLTVERTGDRINYGIPDGLVQLSVPNRTTGRIRARYLAGRTVTPGQAAIALRRVLYLNGLST